MLLGLTCAIVVIILDQLSKYYVMEHILNEYGAISFTSFFNLVRAWNTGVSFSMFENGGTVGVILLSTLSITIVCFLLYWLYKEEIKVIQVALGFIIGGAIGNVIDRVSRGAVFDFLDFHLGDHHWPAFNLADSFICIGATIIIIHGLFFAHKKEEEEK